MPEPVKCPRCEEGELYERYLSYSYQRIVRTPDGQIDYGEPDWSDEGEVDCWTCLDCGAVLDWEEQKAIYDNE